MFCSHFYNKVYDKKVQKTRGQNCPRVVILNPFVTQSAHGTPAAAEQYATFKYLISISVLCDHLSATL